jgi:hypothetical protein
LFSDYKQYDWLTRTAAWDILWPIIRLEPLLGTGFANYYWYTPLYNLLGYNVSFNSHNNYVDIAAETGVAGLLCFAWFFWQVGRLAWRLRERVPAGFARAYVYGGIGGLAGTLVAALLGDWVLPFVYNVGMAGFRTSLLAWLFLGGLVVLEQGACCQLSGEPTGAEATGSADALVAAPAPHRSVRSCQRPSGSVG